MLQRKKQNAGNQLADLLEDVNETLKIGLIKNESLYITFLAKKHGLGAVDSGENKSELRTAAGRICAEECNLN